MADKERVNEVDISRLKPDEPAAEAPRNLVPMSPGELAVASVAATAKAMVEVRYLMALRKPRDWDVVRQNVLKECRRPGFAHNKSVYYVKPIGDGVEGLGIRFAEAAIRCCTNIHVVSSMLYEDDQKEVHHVAVTDLESNTPYEQDVRVSKLVERSKPLDDGTFISRRKNSYGKWVYTITGTEDDILNKRGAAISKVIRTLALRIIPGDIQDEAEAEIKAIRLKKAAADPDAERKAIADGFLEIGVPAADLIAFLGHGLDTCSPAELVKLRGIFSAIRDDEATWAQVVENGWAGAPKKNEAAKKDAGGTLGTPSPKPGGADGATGTALDPEASVQAQAPAEPAPSPRKPRRPAPTME